VSKFDYSQEVAWGQGQERKVAERWLAALEETPQRIKGARLEKGEMYADYDFKVFDSFNQLRCYLEVKVRRTAWHKYRDVLLPARKHEFAKRNPDVPCLAVILFSDEVLVEVDLLADPSRTQMIRRRDRDKAVPHVIYDEDKCRVL